MVYGEGIEDEAFVGMLKRRVNDIESGTATGRDAFTALEELKRNRSR